MVQGRLLVFLLTSLAMHAASECTLHAIDKPAVCKRSVSMDAIKSMCHIIYAQATQSATSFEPELIIGVSRGGLVPLCFLAGEGMFNKRHVKVISVASYNDQGRQDSLELLASWGPDDFEYLKRFRSILVVDDLVDSGKSLSFVLNLLQAHAPHATIKTAVLFYKKCSSITPDYYAQETTDWIVFPWEF